MQYSKYFKFSISLLSLLTLTTSIIFLQKKDLNQSDISRDKNYYLKEQEQFTINAKLNKKMPSFGLSNLIADWTFLQFVQYFGDSEARKITGYSTVTDYFEDIVNRDPNFMQSHLVMSAANSLFAANPIKTVELMNQALKNVDQTVPNYPFLLWTYKAADEILFLGDLKAAKDSFENAAQWAKQWAKYHQDEKGNTMAARYEKSAAFLATNPDPTQAQIGAWMMILSTARDEKTATYVIDKLNNLGVEVSISDKGELVVKNKQDQDV